LIRLNRFGIPTENRRSKTRDVTVWRNVENDTVYFLTRRDTRAYSAKSENEASSNAGRERKYFCIRHACFRRPYDLLLHIPQPDPDVCAVLADKYMRNSKYFTENSRRLRQITLDAIKSRCKINSRNTDCYFASDIHDRSAEPSARGRPFDSTRKILAILEIKSTYRKKTCSFSRV